MSRVVVSACLLGRPCRYDGGQKSHNAVHTWAREQKARGHEVVAVCPEELGGLGTPRPAAELLGGDGLAVLHGRARVEDERGRDVTAAFVAGAHAAAEEANGAIAAVVKARSPSCGCGTTRIGGELREGDGVFAALLRSRAIPLLTEEELDKNP